MKQLNVRLLLAAISVLLLARPVRADSITITLTQTAVSGAAGTTVDFNAVLTAPSSNAATVFLNGDSATFVSTFLSIDDSVFNNNAPLSLNPGDTTSPFPLFGVVIAPGTPAGSYKLNSYSILGGSNGSSSGDVADAQFEIDVLSNQGVPEPGTLGLLIAGMAGAIATRLRPVRVR